MRHTFLPVLAAAGLAACSAAPAGAQSGNPPAARDARTLVVTGTGEAAAAPDLITLSIGVETQADTAAAALDRNREQMRAAIDRLKQRGVAERDMQTSNLSVNPRYNYEDNRSPEIIGYSASNMLTVKLRDLDAAGGIIDEAFTDGANTLNGINFSFADDAPLINEARKAAVADARSRAETLAEAADVSLGPILQIQDGHAAAPPVAYRDSRMMAAEAKSTPIEAGESTVTATVTIVYEIR